LDRFLRRTNLTPHPIVASSVQFNLRLILAFLLDEYLSPSVVNLTFIYLYPRDR